MIGVYKITNKLNNKSYVGISVDIENRWKEHKLLYNWERESKKTLYRAFKKYGLNNFEFSVLKECQITELGDLEKYYIKQYDSYNNGYNSTSGGEDNYGEGHPGHKLTEKDIVDIRLRYKNLERKNEVYALYADRIGESGFHKIWNCSTWKGILEDVYTPEIKKFHSHNTANKGSKNGRSKLSEEDVKNIRLRRKAGEVLSKVYEDY